MPAIVAHHQFGVLVAKQLPAIIKDVIDAHQAFFTLGLQGPDLLFYYKPLSANSISQLGHTIHSESGHTFFASTLCPELHQDLDQLAYLLGVCCHYCLDRACHPLVEAVAKGDSQVHQALEAALDGHIIALHGMSRQRTYYLPPLEDYAPVAHAYGLDTCVITRCARSFRFYTRLLSAPKLVAVGERILGKEGIFSSLCLPNAPCYQQEVATLYDQFHLSIAHTVDLMQAFYCATQHDTPCPEGCDENFGGMI